MMPMVLDIRYIIRTVATQTSRTCVRSARGVRRGGSQIGVPSTLDINIPVHKLSTLVHVRSTVSVNSIQAPSCPSRVRYAMPTIRRRYSLLLMSGVLGLAAAVVLPVAGAWQNGLIITVSLAL